NLLWSHESLYTTRVGGSVYWDSHCEVTSNCTRPVYVELCMSQPLHDLHVSAMVLFPYPHLILTRLLTPTLNSLVLSYFLSFIFAHLKSNSSRVTLHAPNWYVISLLPFIFPSHYKHGSKA